MLANLEQNRARAERYQLWYKEDGLKDALQAIRQSYIDGLVSTHANDTDGREKYYTAIRTMDNIESHILSVIGGGKIAAKELERVEKEFTQPKIRNLF